MDADKTYREKARWEQYKIATTYNPESNTTQNNGCTATYLPSQKSSKKDKQDVRNTAGATRMNSSKVLLWTPSYGRASVGRLARIYRQQQLCMDTGCSQEDLLEAMDDRDGWRERVNQENPFK